MSSAKSDVMEMSGTVETPSGRVDLHALTQALTADGFEVLTATTSDGRFTIKARWPTRLVLGGRPISASC